MGKPNVFLSHAWSYRFVDVVNALGSFSHEGEQLFFWFDCFSIDEHATQRVRPVQHNDTNAILKTCFHDVAHAANVRVATHADVLHIDNHYVYLPKHLLSRLPVFPV